MDADSRPLWRRLLYPQTWAVRAVRLVAILLFAPVLVLLGCQHRLIYHPPRYPESVQVPTGVVTFHFQTGEGQQAAYWMPPRTGAEPQRIWMVCSGNATAALQWPDWLATVPDASAGFLLIDYPGYGANEGSPDPARILAVTEAAVRALAEHLRLTPEAVEARLGLFGHSLGCASALQHAARHPVRRIVLVAPFTTMLAMARRMVGWPLCHVLLHRFDNEARLAELAATTKPPPIVIFHGDRDQVIPVEMGRALAQAHPGFVTCHEIAGADHDGILEVARTAIQRALAER